MVIGNGRREDDESLDEVDLREVEVAAVETVVLAREAGRAVMVSAGSCDGAESPCRVAANCDEARVGIGASGESGGRIVSGCSSACRNFSSSAASLSKVSSSISSEMESARLAFFRDFGLGGMVS